MADFKRIEVADPDYLSGLGQLPLSELRARRESCAELEMEISYLRRLVQARVDLIVAESERRQLGLSEPNTEILVEQLPQILGDHARAGGPGRLPAFLAPAQGARASLAARVEDILPSERLGSLSELASDELDLLLDRLSALERDVSAERRALHDVQDRLQEELVRRYRSGEATVDALLG
ncbi:MAG: aerial mycelium formation protein [Acidimicrobiales bacterium]